jgi:hypothetical protein
VLELQSKAPEAPEFSKGILTNDELLKIVGVYLSVATDAPLDDNGNASDIICDLLSERLIELARLNPTDTPTAAMWIVECAVSCAAAATSEPPQKAITMIASFYAKLENYVDDLIAQAKRHAAKEPT